MEKSVVRFIFTVQSSRRSFTELRIQFRAEADGRTFNGFLYGISLVNLGGCGLLNRTFLWCVNRFRPGHNTLTYKLSDYTGTPIPMWIMGLSIRLRWWKDSKRRDKLDRIRGGHSHTAFHSRMSRSSSPTPTILNTFLML